MPRGRPIQKILWIALAGAVSLAPAVADTGGYTVGDLTLRLAGTLQVVTWDEEPTPEVARARLAEVGLAVSGDLDRPLRERDMVVLLTQTGVSVTTSDPENPLDREDVDRILGMIFLDSPEPVTIERDGDPLRRRIARFCRNHPGNRFCRIIASIFQP